MAEYIGYGMLCIYTCGSLVCRTDNRIGKGSSARATLVRSCPSRIHRFLSNEIEYYVFKKEIVIRGSRSN